MRRGAFWTAVVAGVLLLVGGSTIAVLGYSETGGPDGAVREYFSALARGNAPKALAYGDLPTGSHALLTSQVLAIQQRNAPLRDFAVTATRTHGGRATVSVRYVLDYPHSPQTVNTDVPVHRRGSDWRLDQVAVRTSLDLDRAADRASIGGAPVPADETLLFPGAVPITFDTPYLQLDAAEDSIGFASRRSALVYVEVSPAGKAAVVAALKSALGRCLDGRGDLTCPLPDERFVPGSLRGTLEGSLAENVRIELGPEDAGVLTIGGDQPVHASTYRKLSFRNQPETGSGTVVIQLTARAYAVPPLRFTWGAS